MNRLKKTARPRALFTPVTLLSSQKKSKKRWVLLPFFWSGLKRFAMVVGFFAILTNIAIWYTLLSSTADAPQVPSEAVLVLEFKEGISEKPSAPSFADPFPQNDPTLHQMVEAIEAAATDNRVKGIIARMRDGAYSLSHIQELRAALKKFKESGKFTKIYSSSYGGFGSGLGRYYLASIFDEIWMQPMGLITISGMNAEMPFLRGSLDKLGIEPQFYQRKEYKTAYENITDKTMSAPNREATQALIDDIKDVLVEGITADRGLEEKRFLKLVDQGLFTSDEAIEANLLDYNNYPDVMLTQMKDSLDGDYQSISDLPLISVAAYNRDREILEQPAGMMDYIWSFNEPKQEKPSVALIYAVGAIMPKDTSAQIPSQIIGGTVAAADKIAPAILRAANDPSVETIVLRVDSPGGSPAASEAILRALEIAKTQKDKNIIISMSTVAASGGYWIATNADQVFVLPTTITGSIGVVGGKFAFGELWKKLGVHWDSVKWGQNASMWSFNTPFSKSEENRVNAMMDHVYASFISRVAKGRQMSIPEVEKIAGGRVWSGKAALDVGLADQFGGLSDALDYAANLSGKENRSEISVKLFPRPKTTMEQIVTLLNGGQVSLGLSGGQNVSNYVLNALRPVLQPVVMAHEPEMFMTYEALELYR